MSQNQHQILTVSIQSIEPHPGVKHRLFLRRNIPPRPVKCQLLPLNSLSHKMCTGNITVHRLDISQKHHHAFIPVGLHILRILTNPIDNPSQIIIRHIIKLKLPLAGIIIIIRHLRHPIIALHHISQRLTHIRRRLNVITPQRITILLKHPVYDHRREKKHGN